MNRRQRRRRKLKAMLKELNRPHPPGSGPVGPLLAWALSLPDDFPDPLVEYLEELDRLGPFPAEGVSLLPEANTTPEARKRARSLAILLST